MKTHSEMIEAIVRTQAILRRAEDARKGSINVDVCKICDKDELLKILELATNQLEKAHGDEREIMSTLYGFPRALEIKKCRQKEKALEQIIQTVLDILTIDDEYEALEEMLRSRDEF